MRLGRGRVLSLVAEGSFTALGFFWKAVWAFVLGYFISAMICVFVPKNVVRFAFDYPFWLSVTFAVVAAWLLYLHRRHQRAHGAMEHDIDSDGPLETASAAIGVVLLVGGLVLRAVETL